ncbi:MAG: hypothetical protein ACAI44_39675 [Candidatus Sericytochromatia bacterium]
MGFANYCDQYMRQEIGLGEITRYLSEATADAEMRFGEYSFLMSLEQLQRYGVIQTTLDNMTFQLFDTEIKRNCKIVLEALKNGEYFIIGLTYNSIKSSIYMMFSKQKIKTEQERKLAELEQEHASTQAIVKVLKAIESIILVEDLGKLDFPKIQKALEIYINYFKNAKQDEIKQACDDRIFKLLEQHIDFLRSMGFGGDPARAAAHFTICCDTVQPLAQTERQRTMLAAWRSLLS